MTELDIERGLESIDFSSSAQQEHRPEYWVNDRTKGMWNDAYTARKRVFPDGQCEVTVVKERFFVGPANTAVTRAKRGESENREANDDDAARRAKKNVRLCCKQICADRLVTLTYRENMVDREVALKHFKEFCRRLGRVHAFHYVAVIEEQSRGALHFHVAVRGAQNYVLLRSIWQRILGQGAAGEQMGQVNVRNPHKFGFGAKENHKLASYIAKYCGKNCSAVRIDPDFVGPIRPVRALDEKRYFRSRGIVVPEVRTWRLPCTSMLGAVQAAFRALEGYSMEGMQTWCNNALGVVSLFTAPGPVPGDCPF